MRSLPLAADHEALHASFAAAGAWRLPLDYGDAAKEQRAGRATSGLIDLTAKGKIRVTGPDRLSFLDGLLTNDLKPLRAGQGVYAATLDHKGRVHGDLVAYELGDSHLLAIDPDATEPVLAHLNKQLVSDDVTLEDVSTEFAILGIYGPRSGDLAAKIVGRAPAQPFDHAQVEKEGRSLRIARSPAFGGEGYELWIPAGDAAEFWRQILAAGATPFGQRAAEALRIEAGRPKYPEDMNEETLAVEARLEDAISATKGCYIGQEVVSRATNIGHVNRRLVGLRVDSESPPTARTKVDAAGKPVGFVTSAAKSASLGKVVALAYVRVGSDALGTPLAVEGASARVAALPFVRF